MRNEAFWTWYDEFARPKLAGRKDTFAIMFEHLDTFDRPVVIIETGCIEDPEAWGNNGCSTILFGRYAAERNDGSTVLSVDIIQQKVMEARKIVPNALIEFGDSIDRLARWASLRLQADLLYLDASHLYWDDPLPSAIHHHAELIAAMPMIRPDTMVVVDDSPPRQEKDAAKIEVAGKGYLVAVHMDLCGADFVFCQYQAGWKNVRPLPVRATAEDLETLVGRARAHIEAGRPINAERLYRLILGLTTAPKTGHARVAHGEACAFYAKIASDHLRFGVSADWYREALQSDPLASDYRLDMVLNALMPMGAKHTAMFEADKATKISPDYWRTWHVYGGIAHALDDAKEAIRAYDRELVVAGETEEKNDALLDRASIAIETWDYETALKMVQPVLDTGRRADAEHCMAMICYRLHQHEEAIVWYQRAIADGCKDLPMAHWNMSLAMHSIGKYREAWVAHHWRGKAIGNAHLSLPLRRFTLPLWDGESATKEDGTRAVIHVHAEAGHGDNLALMRYLRCLKDLGFIVRYEAADPMVDLARSSFPDIKIFPKARDYPGALGIEPFDYHIPIGELPYAFKTDIDTVPWSGAYLKPDPILVDRYRARLAGHRGPKIGLCWSSGIRDGIWLKEYGLRKSMHLSKLLPLIDAGAEDGCLFVNLQVGPERDQIGEVKPPHFIDVMPQRPNWADTAAVVENLDLVISVDTAIAHLAGGMDKPLWIMMQRDGCSWHFLCWYPGASWNEASPWYPSARKFRQHEFETPHFWDEVIADVIAALGQFCAERRAVAAE